MTDDLVLTPAIQAELIGSLFKLALKSGSKLGDEVRKQLPGNMQTVFTGLVNAMGTGANGALAVVNNSPMAMIGIKNPVVYFGTPGSAPPRRADMEAPPFGLGLLLKGQLIFDAGNGIPTLEIANGVAKVNLSDGFYLSGSVTPPAPFASSAMTLSASQSLTSPVPNLTFTGPLGLPGMTIPVINKSAGMDGSFSVTKTSGGANISAGVTIASILSRTVSMNINGGTMHVYSNPGGCVDVPLKIDGHIPMSGPPNPTQWLTFFQPYVPDVVGCLTDLGKEVAKVAEAVGKGIGEGAVYVGNQIATGGKKAYKWASKAFGGNSPARPVYDCTEAGLDSDETAIAYPPGRIWGGRDEYTRGASSGAWARYIFSEKTGKFHPFGAKGALGANACGLVGEEGATGNRIWDMALMCHTIPESMKGPGFYTIEQCYELRGLSGPPKPEHVGKVLSAAPGWWYLAGNDGKLHHVRDAAMLEACWQKPEHIIGITLDEIYRMPTGSPITNGNECLRLAAGPNRREFRGLMIQGNGPAWYLVGREGKRHWLPNFDVVDGCGPWRQGNRSPVQLGDAINFFEEGPGLPSGQDCWGKQTVDHINWATSARAAQKLLDDNKRALEQALALANAVPNRCQQLADENGIGDKVGWGWAPQSVRDEWWNKACGTKYGKKMYGGDVKRVCPAFRQRFGIIDNKTWGTAQDREVQNTYINFGCKAGV